VDRGLWTGVLPTEVVLQPYNVVFIRGVAWIGMLPDLGHHAEALGADEAMTLALVELDDLIYLEVLDRALLIGAADGYTGFAGHEFPDLGAAEVILPGEALAVLHDEDLGAELTGHLREGYLHRGEELVAELAGLAFVDDEEATPRTLKVARGDCEAEAVEVLLYGGEYFFFVLFSVREIQPQIFQCLTHDSGTYFLIKTFYEARQIKPERAIKANFIFTLIISF